jgi:hypothetical protein
MRLLLALGLVTHGFIHIGYVCTPISFASTGPGFLTDAVAAGTIDGIGNALVAVTAIAFLLAALATAGVLVPDGWWRPLVIVASIASAIVLAFSPTAWTVPGLLIDAVLLAAGFLMSSQRAAFFGRRAALERTAGAEVAGDR